MTTASSSSDRLEAARKALAAWDAGDGNPVEDALLLAGPVIDALRALIEPPDTLETPEEIAERMLRVYGNILTPVQLMAAAVRAGIDAAWESWEPDSYSSEYGEGE